MFVNLLIKTEVMPLSSSDNSFAGKHEMRFLLLFNKELLIFFNLKKPTMNEKEGNILSVTYITLPFRQYYTVFIENQAKEVSVAVFGVSKNTN